MASRRKSKSKSSDEKRKSSDEKRKSSDKKRKSNNKKKRKRSPQEKKKLSHAKDRRNVYGEAPHGARKSIPRGKARDLRRERRASRQALVPGRGASNESTVDSEGADALDEVTNRATVKRHRRFTKYPDAPLGVVIRNKLEKRAERRKR